MRITDRIVKTAETFIGHEEILEDLKFNREEFSELTQAVGGDESQAWCTYFTELIWKMALSEEESTIKELELLFSSGSIATWNNFRRSEWIVSESPRIGATAVWQTFKNSVPQWSGNMGVVKGIEDLSIITINGVIINRGSENLIVMERRSVPNFKIKDGLRLRGFIYPEKAIV